MINAHSKTRSLRKKNPSPIASYSYDAPGRRTGFNGGITTSYGYDVAGRLSSLTNDLPATSHNNQWSFQFNPAGQITSTTRTNDLFAWGGHYNVSRNYTANGLNQYTAAGGAAFCHDANGNLTADGGSVYLYDVENRLVEMREQGPGNSNCAALSYGGPRQAGLRYDPAGRLYEVIGPGGTTRMLYDGDALVAEYDTAGTLLRRYAHGADGAADDPIAWYEGAAFTLANQRVMRSDWQGSIVLVTDNSGGAVLAVNRYDEYGIPQGSNAGRFQYTGQAWLAELGMYYYKARIYSPTLGRFLQTDPIGYEDQVNLYAYVGGDPVNRRDPTGMYECKGSADDCAKVASYHKQLQQAASERKIGSRLEPANPSAQRALIALGGVNEKNGVTVKFDNTLENPGNTKETTSPFYNLFGGKRKFDITLNTSMIDKKSGPVTLGHEGIHVLLDLSKLKRPLFDQEFIAYFEDLSIGRALGWDQNPDGRDRSYLIGAAYQSCIRGAGIARCDKEMGDWEKKH